jgi:3-isopropylmalate/(R)-2-methylmalate dehydratase small subunit
MGTEMKTMIQGKVFTFGDNIDTDIIAPAMTISFGIADSNEMEDVKKHAFEEIRPNFYQEVEPGSILVAGRNFGFGSHREQATTVIANMGFEIILADSVARLYQRNSIAIGFPVLEVPGISSKVAEGQELRIDLKSWELTNLTTKEVIELEPLSETALNIIEHGGIVEFMVSKLEEVDK